MFLFLLGAISSCTLYLFLFGSKKKKDAVPIWAKTVPISGLNIA
jgi:hypothetical protein